ncbi:MAG TPA: HD domain-containing phosphohydrolase [Gemmatimonadaceae bacterium]
MTAAAKGKTDALPRILCVDDDLAISGVLSRVLGTLFDVTVASSAAEGLAHVRSDPPYAVVVSDYRMPGTDGVTFLVQVCEIAPDTVRILLTGNGDLDTAVAAVNRGQIFRFLTKPCAPDVLRTAVSAAAEQHRLVTAERVLLEQTLHGSIKALIDVLALAQPQAFGRATRVRRLVADLAVRANVRDQWSIEIAAMLSQVGYAALPAESVDRFYAGERLSDSERQIIAKLPATAERLIGDIPRLDAVREILRFQDTRFDGRSGDGAMTNAGTVGEAIPIGARMLKIVLDFDMLDLRGLAASDALGTMAQHPGWYDPKLLAMFTALQGTRAARVALQDMRLSQVRVGMVFAAEVRAENGMLLVARGQEVSESLVERIHQQWISFATKSVVSMLVEV